MVTTVENMTYSCETSGHIMDDRTYAIDRKTVRRPCVVPGCYYVKTIQVTA